MIFILFKKIKFINLNKKDFLKIIHQPGLFVFPSGPGLTVAYLTWLYFKILRKVK